MTLTILEKCWLKLDATMVELMEGDYPQVDIDPPHARMIENPEKIRLKGVCRGQAEVIAEFMKPYFVDADAIALEAKRRYDARKAGESYETIGLGHLRYQGPHDSKNPGRMPAAPAQPKPAHNFTQDEVESIKFAAESGMFTNEQLAKTYKVTVQAIEAVLAS